jgi:hypothetical protein
MKKTKYLRSKFIGRICLTGLFREKLSGLSHNGTAQLEGRNRQKTKD